MKETFRDYKTFSQGLGSGKSVDNCVECSTVLESRYFHEKEDGPIFKNAKALKIFRVYETVENEKVYEEGYYIGIGGFNYFIDSSLIKSVKKEKSKYICLDEGMGLYVPKKDIEGILDVFMAEAYV